MTDPTSLDYPSRWQPEEYEQEAAEADEQEYVPEDLTPVPLEEKPHCAVCGVEAPVSAFVVDRSGQYVHEGC